ncbi:fatty-acyl-CoA synthase [Mytilus galloprovincialis]|uniref:Fatty-acyl-CoA synthase n=1 Tax=Mytilus galloprovincialis TaxID=29158 RepID=A0A8B6D7Y9_MYTGA|nr:fatty-acyl-CoA synthase [Mytilus galloprovincialis]
MDHFSLSYDQLPMTEPFMHCTIPDRIQYYATDSPNKAAFIIHSTSGSREVITCKDLYQQSQTFAKGLVHLGIKKNDTIGLSFPNSKEWLVSTFGILMAGAVPLHMAFKYKDGRDIIPVLQIPGNCKAILMANEKDSSIRDFLDNILTRSETETKKMELKKERLIPSLKFVALDNSITGFEDCCTISDILSTGTKYQNINLPFLDPDDIAAFLLTSGSTGMSKLVPKTHLQMLEFGQGFIAAYNMESCDVYFNDRLFNWGAGYPTVFLACGATHVTSSDQFTLQSISEICNFAIEIIKQDNCTVSQFLPAFAMEILKRDENEISQRVIATSGVPVSKDCAQVVPRFCKEFICLYGSTEMGCVSVKRSQAASDFSDYNVGKPLPGVEMKVVNSEGKTLPQNEVGELFVRHRVAFGGYHRNPDKTNKVLATNGWYKTDDIAFMNEKGDFTVTGRCSDIILCHGELISPSYIEDEIKIHPAVAEVCVVPVSDPVCFQKVCVCIVLRKGSLLSEDELIIYLSEGVKSQIKFQENSRIHLFFESFPKTAVGKIFRRGVKEEAEHRVNGRQ